jgi:hypothetical protein
MREKRQRQVSEDGKKTKTQRMGENATNTEHLRLTDKASYREDEGERDKDRDRDDGKETKTHRIGENVTNTEDWRVTDKGR